jgi:hypothetical protein
MLFKDALSSTYFFYLFSFNELNNYLKITAIINNMFTPQETSKKTKIKQFSTIVLPALLYSSENWNIKARDAERITVAEMIYTRKTAEHTWTDYKPNTQIAKKQNTIPVLGKIQEYGRNWLQNTNRMPHNRLMRIPKATDQR